LSQPRGRWSPYAGFNLWHHAAGLIFGIFTLSWVLSGLLSMNPWGWLEGGDSQAEDARLRGTPPVSLERVGAALEAFAGARTAAVSLQAAPMNGRLYFVAATNQGMRRRFDAAATPAPLSSADLSFLAASLDDGAPPTPMELLRSEDDLYFGHHGAVALPVYRMTPAGSATRYYLDSVSGMLIAKMDGNARAYRWLHQGLHRLDLTAWLRRRPQWDMLMLGLLAGTTIVCVTGAYLGCRRLMRWCRRIDV
jgi:hypothetical protein